MLYIALIGKHYVWFEVTHPSKTISIIEAIPESEYPHPFKDGDCREDGIVFGDIHYTELTYDLVEKWLQLMDELYGNLTPPDASDSEKFMALCKAMFPSIVKSNESTT